MPSTRLVPVGGIRHTLAEPGETQVAVRYEVDAASVYFVKSVFRV